MAKRRPVIAGLVLLLLAGLVVALWPAPHSDAEGPATHAVLLGNGGPLDVWRDSHQRLTFHWVVDNSGEVSRYDPSTLRLSEFSDGEALGSTTYLSDHAAWRTIHALYGVDKAGVATAIASGRPSPEPVDFAVATPRHKGYSSLYEGHTDYGTDVARMAKDTGLVVPDPKTLEGRPLSDAICCAQGLAGLAYGQVEINLAKYEPGRPNAAGTVYKEMYDRTRARHRHGPVEYVDQGWQLTVPYGAGEWIMVSRRTKFSPSEAVMVIREILRAPAAG
jgi:hypothetical protein